MLAHHGVRQSMSRKGNCFDNAAILSFFGTLREEYYHLEHMSMQPHSKQCVHDYINY